MSNYAQDKYILYCKSQISDVGFLVPQKFSVYHGISIVVTLIFENPMFLSSLAMPLQIVCPIL